MNIGILLAGFSANETDTAIPVQHHLIKQLAEEVHVRVLALRYPHTRKRYKFFNAEVIPLGYTAQARRLRRFQLWVEAIYALRRLHKERPFDALHAIWGDETGLIAAWAGRLLNIPVVVSLVGGELVYLDDIDYGLQGSPFSRWIVKQAITGADVVITPCTYMDNLLANLPYTAKRLERVVLGIDTEQFSPAPKTASSRKLIHVASLIPVKDQVTLLKALAQLPDDITLDIVGEGSSRPMLENLAQDLNIQHRVHFLGTVPHHNLPDLFRKATLHILTSRHEGLGMVTLEAAACGIPTISTDVGLLPDYPQMGITVPVGDTNALAQAIDDLLNHPEPYHALCQSARQQVVQNFTIAHTISHYQRIYTNLINE